MEKIKNILTEVFLKLENPESEIKKLIVSEWENIAGEKLSKITTPRISKNGFLIVLVKENIHAFEIRQRYQNSLLKRAQSVVGEKNLKGVKVIVDSTR